MNAGPGWGSAIKEMDVGCVDAIDAMEDEIAPYSEPLNDEAEVDTNVLRRFPRIVPFCVFSIENNEGSCTINCFEAVPWGRVFAFCGLNAAAFLMIRH